MKSDEKGTPIAETMEDYFKLWNLVLGFRAIDEMEERLKNQSLISWKEWAICFSLPFLIVGFFIVFN